MPALVIDSSGSKVFGKKVGGAGVLEKPKDTIAIRTGTFVFGVPDASLRNASYSPVVPPDPEPGNFGALQFNLPQHSGLIVILKGGI